MAPTLSPARTTTTAAPPDGYPETSWADDGTFWVSPELREWYVSAAESGAGSREDWGAIRDRRMTATVPGDNGQLEEVPVDYSLWAHITRRERARQLRQAHQGAVEYEARKRPCVVCEARLDYFELKAVGIPSGGVVYVCAADAGALRTELEARAVVRDGLTRQQLVTATVDRLLGAES